MNVQSWQIPCPRCGWANSGALNRCAKCGQPLAQRPGMLVAGQSASARARPVPVTGRVARPGGLLPRLIALVIDYIVLGAVMLPIYALWSAQLTPPKATPDSGPSFEFLRGSPSFYLTLFLIYLFYFAGSWSILGATPGQLLMSLRVTDTKAQGLGFFKAVWRYVTFSLFFVIWPVSALMVALGKEKRAIHDLLSSSYVIQLVDQVEVEAKDALPPVFDNGATTAAVSAAAAPPAAPPPAPEVPASNPEPAMAAAPAGTSAPGVAYPAPPLSPAPHDPAPTEAYVPPPPQPDSAEAYVPPPPPSPELPAETEPYSPPPLVDAGTSLEQFTAPAPSGPADREVYTPPAGVISERVAHSADLYAAPAAPPTSAAPGPAEAPGIAPAPDAEDHDTPVPAQPPSSEGELPPIEFPPMAPPPEDPAEP